MNACVVSKKNKGGRMFISQEFKNLGETIRKSSF